LGDHSVEGVDEMTDELSPITSAPAKISLREQADEAHRELVMRHRVYPGLVKRGKMSASEAEVGFAVMRAMRDTLRMFAEYEPEIREALKKAIEAHREIEQSPLAKTVHDAFPGAAMELRPLSDQLEFMGPDSGDGASFGVPADTPAVGSSAP
jgi:hypothetical protein